MTGENVDRVVIVGAGHAGGECAASLRLSGYTGEVVLIGEEEHLPYQRPPLSKAYLLGRCGIDGLLLRPADFYRKQLIHTVLGHRVESIDRDARTVVTNDGERIAYSHLVLAMGGAARRLPDPVAEKAPNVHYIRSISDVDGLRAALIPATRLVVVGGGYIGLEAASVARKLGVEVTVLEAAPRLLARVAGPEVSEFFRRVHIEQGVDVRVNVAIEAFESDAAGRVTGVRLSGGEVIPAQSVLVGIGLVPNDWLAATSGLDVDDGVIVDEYCRTSDPAIYAIGDLSRHPCSERGGSRRLESMQNAAEQARHVAASITGNPKPYRSTPWFWSDQYDLKLQSVGTVAGYDRVVIRGDTTRGRSFAAFYLTEGRVRAAEVVGSAKDFAAARRLVALRKEVPETVLMDQRVPLREIATS